MSHIISLDKFSYRIACFWCHSLLLFLFVICKRNMNEKYLSIVAVVGVVLFCVVVVVVDADAVVVIVIVEN